MITERDMVIDALSSVKHDILDLTRAAEESSNQNVRQALIDLRNKAEQTQTQLADIATKNGWYVPAQPEDHQTVTQMKQQFQTMVQQDTTNSMFARH